MKYSFLKFLENKMSSGDDESIIVPPTHSDYLNEPQDKPTFNIPIITPREEPKPISFPDHLKVGDYVMVDPRSDRYKKTFKEHRDIFKKTYGRIIEYPKDGEMRGRVKVRFELRENGKFKPLEIETWFEVRDLFVRPKHI